MNYSHLYSMIVKLNQVSMGDNPCDLLLKNCSLINVYSNEIIKNIQISILGDRIAYVGIDASHTIGPNTLIIDLEGMYISPGFADSHIHIDQFILPTELVKNSLIRGVTALFSESIDIVSTCGYKGFAHFVRSIYDLPIRIFTLIPGGLPVDDKLGTCKHLNEQQEDAALRLPHVIGLGEVFSWTKVTERNNKIMKKLSKMLKNEHVINGHTAGATNKKLNAYISSGILSCHEPINFNELIERLRLGMWLMIREGSIRRDLNNIMPYIIKNQIFKNQIMFCSDGLNPNDLTNIGHIEHCIRDSIKCGLNPIDAIRIASKNCFDYYGLTKDFGGISPGKVADMVVFDDLHKIIPNKVFVGGKLIASKGNLLTTLDLPKIPTWLTKTIKTRNFSSNSFKVKTKIQDIIATTIYLKTEIITKRNYLELHSVNDNIVPSYDKDVWKIAAIDRIFNSNRYFVGFLQNFGSEIGAFASTLSFHENHMIVIGLNENDMAIASNQLTKIGGGMIVVKNGKILALMPLKYAGILSIESFEKVRDEFNYINSIIKDFGCKFQNPYLIPLFLPFLALPEIRITCNGIINIKSRTYEKILK
ncbi:MAG: amidohydrolase family protein [Thaumarchaeota archaeon]|nr:amidohydrolase family protein [Nitrososphaerota archaeon]MCY3976093.1 amidohydrolase family protein [Nitrososphaerota archaeon]